MIRWFPLLLCLVAYSGPQETPCDPDVLPIETSQGYQKRDTRCAGLYKPKVNSTPLWLASLTVGDGSFDATTDGSQRLQWQGPGKQTINLRGESLRPKLHFRMDAQITQDHYQWPLDLLASQKLTSNEWGILAWYTKDNQKIHLPVTYGQEVPAAQPYQVTLVPGQSLKKVYLTLTAVDDEGKNTAFVVEDEIVEGYFTPNRKVDIPLPHLDRKGRYRLEIAAELASGGTAVTHLLFQHGK